METLFIIDENLRALIVPHRLKGCNRRSLSLRLACVETCVSVPNMYPGNPRAGLAATVSTTSKGGVARLIVFPLASVNWRTLGSRLRACTWENKRNPERVECVAASAPVTVTSQ